MGVILIGIHELDPSIRACGPTRGYGGDYCQEPEYFIAALKVNLKKAPENIPPALVQKACYFFCVRYDSKLPDLFDYPLRVVTGRYVSMSHT